MVGWPGLAYAPTCNFGPLPSVDVHGCPHPMSLSWSLTRRLLARQAEPSQDAAPRSVTSRVRTTRGARVVPVPDAPYDSSHTARHIHA